MTVPVRKWIHGTAAVSLLIASTVMPAVAAGLAYYSNPQAAVESSTAPIPMQFMVAATDKAPT